MDQSTNVYRIPYADGTKVRVSRDHLSHTPPGRIDMGGRDGTKPYRVVAAADGHIRFIVDSFSEHVDSSSGDPCTNNYVWIEHANGEWTKYSHMTQSSTTQTAGLTVGQFVRAGTFLGFEDNVGCATGEHLHWEVGVPRATDPITTTGGFLRDNEDGKRNRIPRICGIAGEVFVAGRNYIAGESLVRRGDESAGGFGELAMHFVRARRLVTALRTENGDLKLICWGLTPPEQFVRRGDVSAGGASRIALAEPRSDIIVTALRGDSGNLRLISWRIDDNGNFTRCADDGAGPVNRVALAAPSEGVVVAAVRTASGNLKLIAWSVASNGNFTRRGEADAGSISAVKLTRTGVFTGVITAVRLPSGNLKLIAWRVSNNGNAITRLGDAEAGAVGDFAVVRRGNNGQFLLTALRDADDDFRLIAWRISANGGSFERLTTGVADKVSEVDIAGAPGSNLSTVVACQDNSGLLRLMTWELSSDGTTLTRCGGALAGEASKISIVATSDSGRDFFVTACATSSGDLKLINWEANL